MASEFRVFEEDMYGNRWFIGAYTDINFAVRVAEEHHTDDGAVYIILDDLEGERFRVGQG